MVGFYRKFTDLPSSSGLFPSPLLDSALTKMHVASNGTLVQWTLHPPKIPQKPSARQVKAGSSSAPSSGRGGASVAVAGVDGPLLRSGRDTRVRHPFHRLLAAPAAPVARIGEKVLLTGSCLCCGWGVTCQCTGGTGRLLEQNSGCCLFCGMDTTSPSRILLLHWLAP